MKEKHFEEIFTANDSELPPLTKAISNSVPINEEQWNEDTKRVIEAQEFPKDGMKEWDQNFLNSVNQQLLVQAGRNHKIGLTSKQRKQLDRIIAQAKKATNGS